MVASYRVEQKRTPLLPYLKPCSPASSISYRAEASDFKTSDFKTSDIKTSNGKDVRVDAFSQSAKLGKWARRGFALGCGIIHTLAIGTAISLYHYERPITSLTPAALEQPVEKTVEQRLWSYLDSPAFEQDRLTGQESRMRKLRLAAAQEHLQAQQLRIDAEEKAEGLVADAVNRARETRMEAMESADRVRLETTLIGAEQVLYAEPGDEVTLKFTARIQCQEGEFGETAISTPVDSRIARREVRNLAACYPNPSTPAGSPIGQVGEWGIAFFKLD